MSRFKILSISLIVLFVLTLTACKRVNTYEVTFKDYDGIVLKVDLVDKGEDATAPITTEREGYSFIGWDKSFINVKENLEISALYEINSYVVEFADYDGTIIDTQNIEHGSNATVITDPTRDGYTFTSWYLEDYKWSFEAGLITQNTTLEAKWEINGYTYTFYDEDNETILKQATINYGEQIIPPNNPFKEATLEYTYTFDSWDKLVPETISSNITFYPLFKAQKNTYTVIFKTDDEILQEEALEYGELPLYKQNNPEKAGYDFLGWDSEVEIVTGNKTYLAMFVSTLFPEHYIMATDDDFTGDADGEFMYIGDADYVIIPEYIKGVKITKTSNFDFVYLTGVYLFMQRKNIKGVIFENPSNVVDMTMLFYSNTSAEIELEYLDTSNVTIMKHMFGTTKATTLDLSLFDTSNVIDMSYMFSASWATTLDLSSFDTSNVTDMSYMFSASKATTINLSSFDTSKVMDMNNMFSSSKVTTLNLSTFDVSNVTDMNNMFYMSEATIINLNSFDTSSVTDMSYMFSNSKATTLDLSSFDTKNVNNMSYMFQKSKATTINLNSFNTANVTNMSWMFIESVANVLDLSSFDTSIVTNMSRMFYMSQATIIDLSSFDTSGVTDMSGMFSYSEVTTLDLSSFDTNNVTNMNNMFSSSRATLGYAKNQEEADKFNSLKNIFVVK